MTYFIHYVTNLKALYIIYIRALREKTPKNIGFYTLMRGINKQFSKKLHSCIM